MRCAPAAGGARWNRIGVDLDRPGWCGAYLPADKAGTGIYGTAVTALHRGHAAASPADGRADSEPFPMSNQREGP